MRDVSYLLRTALAIFMRCLITEIMLKLFDRAMVVLTSAGLLAILCSAISSMITFVFHLAFSYHSICMLQGQVLGSWVVFGFFFFRKLLRINQFSLKGCLLITLR